MGVEPPDVGVLIDLLHSRTFDWLPKNYLTERGGTLYGRCLLVDFQFQRVFFN